MIVDSPTLSTQPASTQPTPPTQPNPTRPQVSTHPVRAYLTSQLTALTLAVVVGWSISPVAGVAAAVVCLPAASAGTAYALTRRPAGRHRVRRR